MSMKTFNWRIAAAVVLVLSAHVTARGQALPSGFVDEAVVRGLTNPTAFTRLPDGTLLIAEKAGIVRVFKNGAALATPFIDLRTTVNDYWDRGLIGIAVDRDFATNGYVYLLYTYENNAADYSGPKTSRLTRVTASNDVAVPGSAVTILGTTVGSSCRNFPAGADCIPADNPSHSVGNIKVASDGTLFVTNGDAASFNVVDDDALRAQNLNSLAGKMLHITPTGQGVPGNPFWDGNPSSNRSKVWAYGMRNPFRFALDPSFGVPFLGDVGWGAWEEINGPNPPTRSVNLGWPCYEGGLHQSGYEPKATCQALYTLGPGGVGMPIIAYPHNTGGGSAVTGGVFYTGTSFPEQYRGAFFYADYAIGFMRYFKVDANGAMSTPLRGFAANLAGPVYIDTDGENLLYVAIYTGEVRRIRFTTPNSGVSYLSDRPWTSMSNGWGPVERDQSVGENNPTDGRVITLNGQVHAKGLGAHAPSDVRFALGGACSSFNASVGVDDEVGSAGSVVFQVWLDGVKAYDSAAMTGATASKTISLNVTGTNELRLVVDGAGNGVSKDHADWAGARVTCTGGGADTTPPTVTAVSPVNGATGVATTSNVTATFSEAMNASTLTTGTMTVVPQGGVTPIGATVTYGAAATRATLAPSALLAANTTYTATVRGGSSGAKDVAGNALAADRVWTFTTAAAGTSSYLSDRPWTSAINGYGPVERDRSNGENLAGDGATITLNGVTYAKGLGVHAAADLRYALGGACTSFTAVLGVDDEVGSNGSVVFQVWTDGVQRYQSGVLTGAMAGQNVTVDLRGANELRLVVNDAGDGKSKDHADWADARVTCTSGGSPPPSVTINQPLSSIRYKVGDVITYSGSATDPEDGTLPGSSLQWSIVIQHCPGGACHTHPFTSSTGSTGTFTIPDHGDESHFQINLTATDSAGHSTSTSVTIQPQTVQLTLNTSPSGLQVVYGGTTATAPVTFTTIVGSAHTIYAPSPQGTLVFASWSDGGAQQHNIVVGASNVTYTATFTTGSGGGSAYLSDRTWTSATNGYGPVERDRSNGENLAGDGRTITLNGVAYAKGLGVHATSDVRYALNGACTSFRAVVGVDDEVGARGSVVFQVWTDGVQRYASGVLTGAMAGETVTVDISGANALALIVAAAGDGIGSDHADWADAQVTCGTTTSTAP